MGDADPGPSDNVSIPSEGITDEPILGVKDTHEEYSTMEDAEPETPKNALDSPEEVYKATQECKDTNDDSAREALTKPTTLKNQHTARPRRLRSIMKSPMSAKSRKRKLRLRFDHRKKPKRLKKVADDRDEESNSLEIEEEDPYESDDALEEDLEEKAKRNNLSTINVKSILHHVVSNEQVQAMIRQEEAGDNMKVDYEPKLTRSKAKSVVENVTEPVPIPLWPISPKKKLREVPQFTELPFSEDSGSDEDYDPSKDELNKTTESDYESVASIQSDLGSPFPDTPLFQAPPRSLPPVPEAAVTAPPIGEASTRVAHTSTAQGGEAPAGGGSTKDETVTTEELIAAMTEVNNQCFGIDDIIPDGTISNRTRSKFPIEVPLEQIEASFVAPDATEDLYGKIVDDNDWQKWLASLFSNAEVSDTNDDDPNDPEFNFLLENEKEMEVADEQEKKEELRTDSRVQVPVSELEELLTEVSAAYGSPTSDNETTLDEDDWRSIESTPCSSSSRLKQVVKPSVKKRLKKFKTLTKDPENVMTEEQREAIRQQLQQHIQLLSQMYLLTRNIPSLEDAMLQARQFVNELNHFASVFEGQNSDVASCHHVRNLDDAVKIVNEPFTRSNVKEVPHRRLAPIPNDVVDIIVQSKVFMYRELLPWEGYQSKQGTRVSFTTPEDTLIVLGLEEFESCEDVESLISEHMVPTKTPKQLKLHMLAVKRKMTQNVIVDYLVHQQLPDLTPLCKPVPLGEEKAPYWQVFPVRKPMWLNTYFNRHPKLSWRRKFMVAPPNLKNLQPAAVNTDFGASPCSQPQMVPVSLTQSGSMLGSQMTVHPLGDETRHFKRRSATSCTPAPLQNPRSITPTPQSNSGCVITVEPTGRIIIKTAPNASQGLGAPIGYRLGDQVLPGVVPKVPIPRSAAQRRVSPTKGGNSPLLKTSPRGSSALKKFRLGKGLRQKYYWKQKDRARRGLGFNTTPLKTKPPPGPECLAPTDNDSSEHLGIIDNDPVAARPDPTQHSQMVDEGICSESDIFLDQTDSSPTSLEQRMTGNLRSVLSGDRTQIGQSSNPKPISEAVIPNPSEPGKRGKEEIFIADSHSQRNVSDSAKTLIDDSGNKGNLEDTSEKDIRKCGEVERMGNSEGNGHEMSIGEGSTSTEVHLPGHSLKFPDDTADKSLHTPKKARQEGEGENVKNVGACEIRSVPEEPPGKQTEKDPADDTGNHGPPKRTVEQVEESCNDPVQRQETASQELPVALGDGGKEADRFNGDISSREKPGGRGDAGGGVEADMVGTAAREDTEASSANMEYEDDGDVDVAGDDDGSADEAGGDEGGNAKKDGGTVPPQGDGVGTGPGGDGDAKKVKRRRLVTKKMRNQMKMESEMRKKLLDPRIMEPNEQLSGNQSFSKSFLTDVKDVFEKTPEKYLQLLNCFQEFSGQVELCEKVFKLLEDHPQLIEKFLIFLPLGSAREQRRLQECLEFIKVRRFLRQVEVYFSDQQSQFGKIVNTIIEWEKEMHPASTLKRNILPLLKGQPQLLQSFLALFADENTEDVTGSRFEVIHIDSNDKKYDSYEEIEFTDSEEEEPDDPGTVQPLLKSRRVVHEVEDEDEDPYAKPRINFRRRTGARTKNRRNRDAGAYNGERESEGEDSGGGGGSKVEGTQMDTSTSNAAVKHISQMCDNLAEQLDRDGGGWIEDDTEIGADTEVEELETEAELETEMEDDDGDTEASDHLAESMDEEMMSPEDGGEVNLGDKVIELTCTEDEDDQMILSPAVDRKDHPRKGGGSGEPGSPDNDDEDGSEPARTKDRADQGADQGAGTDDEFFPSRRKVQRAKGGTVDVGSDYEVLELSDAGSESEDYCASTVEEMDSFLAEEDSLVGDAVSSGDEITDKSSVTRNLRKATGNLDVIETSEERMSERTCRSQDGNIITIRSSDSGGDKRNDPQETETNMEDGQCLNNTGSPDLPDVSNEDMDGENDRTLTSSRVADEMHNDDSANEKTLASSIDSEKGEVMESNWTLADHDRVNLASVTKNVQSKGSGDNLLDISTRTVRAFVSGGKPSNKEPDSYRPDQIIRSCDEGSVENLITGGILLEGANCRNEDGKDPEADSLRSGGATTSMELSSGNEIKELNDSVHRLKDDGRRNETGGAASEKDSETDLATQRGSTTSVELPSSYGTGKLHESAAVDRRHDDVRKNRRTESANTVQSDSDVLADTVTQEAVSGEVQCGRPTVVNTKTQTLSEKAPMDPTTSKRTKSVPISLDGSLNEMAGVRRTEESSESEVEPAFQKNSEGHKIGGVGCRRGAATLGEIGSANQQGQSSSSGSVDEYETEYDGISLSSCTTDDVSRTPVSREVSKAADSTNSSWNSEMDMVILTAVRTRGALQETYLEISQKLENKTQSEVEARYHELMSLLRSMQQDVEEDDSSSLADGDDESEPDA